jgi:hypothetical protein
LRCAHDFGAGYLPASRRTKEDWEHLAIYVATRYKHHELEGVKGIMVNVQDTDDRDDHHSDASVLFRLADLPAVVKVLKKIDAWLLVPDVPEDPWGDPEWPDSFWPDGLPKEDEPRVFEILRSMEGQGGFLVGDILDVPDGFPVRLAKAIRDQHGWRIEYSGQEWEC